MRRIDRVAAQVEAEAAEQGRDIGWMTTRTAERVLREFVEELRGQVRYIAGGVVGRIYAEDVEEILARWLSEVAK